MTTFNRHYHLTQRLARVERLQRTDLHRFKTSPFGDGYLTRQERYLELIWELKRQIAATYKTQLLEAGITPSYLRHNRRD